ncbi:MAG: diguanylate cyclase [Pseudomonadota bacterium]
MEILRLQAQFIVAFSRRAWPKRVLMTVHICLCVAWFTSPLEGLIAALIILSCEALDGIVRRTTPEDDKAIGRLRVTVILANFFTLTIVYAVPGVYLISDPSKTAVIVGMFWASGVVIHNVVNFAHMHLLVWLTTLPVVMSVGYALWVMVPGDARPPHILDSVLLGLSFLMWTANIVEVLLGQRAHRQVIGSARLKTEEQLEHLDHLSRHDALTGAMNRRGFDDILADALQSCGPDAPVSIALIDLNGFKPINDTFGHAAGDAVLLTVAKRLRNRLGHDRIARLGGDEFVVRLHSENVNDALDEAETLRVGVTEPVSFEGHDIAFGAAVGVATSAGKEGVEALIKRADVAMYRAKQAKRDRVFFEPGRNGAERIRQVG